MRIIRLPLAVFLLFSLVIVPPPGRASAGDGLQAGPVKDIFHTNTPTTIQYYDSQIVHSTITNCASIIQGYPYTEYGVGVVVGFAADPDASLPGPGMVDYIHVLIGGLGNACSGQRERIEVKLPDGTGLAISGANPVLCYYDNSPLSGCPQSLPGSPYHSGAYVVPSGDSAHANTWPLAQGHILEIQIPVVSSVSMSNVPLTAYILSLDGETNPWLAPSVGYYVFSNTPTILYLTPSTKDITATSVHSYATLYNHGLTGTAYFDLGSNLNYNLYEESAYIGNANAWLLNSTWSGFTLTPNTLYHWRASFKPDGGTMIYGDDQTFTTLADGQVIVGNGAAADCTGAAFAAALATQGLKSITFNCGDQPVNIHMAGTATVSSPVTIDGGNSVTLSGNNTFGLFDLKNGANLTLNRITLSGGSAICGGAVFVENGASLNTSDARMTGNHSSGNGGALCIDLTGSANLRYTQIYSNTAASRGGGAFVAGLAEFAWDDISGNLAGGDGGGIYNGGNISLIMSLVASNSVPSGGTITDRENLIFAGGGIYNTGSLNINTSTVSGNTASFGGGIYNDYGDVTLFSVTIAGNQANASGTEAFMNAQAGGLESLDATRFHIGSAVLKNTIIANNSANGQTNANCGGANLTSGTVSSGGHNLDSGAQCFKLAASTDKINTDPRLGSLANNGGRTRTMALQGNSPAIDSGDNAVCEEFDQRGYFVTIGGIQQRAVDATGHTPPICDMGAFEYYPTLYSLYLPLIRK